MNLLIDWGNTHIKAVQLKTLSLEELDQAPLMTFESAESLVAYLRPQVSRILVSSVRKEADNQLLAEHLANFNVFLEFAKSQVSSCGIKCAYAEPEFLGVDRWLSIIAGADPEHRVGVIDVGSAITIDLVADNQHLGGQIVPGRSLMRQSLNLTGKVRPKSERGNKHKRLLGESTAECVNFGVEMAIQGYLKHSVSSLQDEYGVSKWLLTGGGSKAAEKILQGGRIETEVRPLLVLEGLVHYFAG